MKIKEIILLNFFYWFRSSKLVGENFRYIWLFHPRSYNEIQNEIPLLKNIPKWFFSLISILIPIMLYSKVSQLNDSDGKPFRGFIGLLPFFSDQIYLRKKLVNRKVIQFSKRANKIGIKVIGFGGLIAGVSNECIEIKPKIPNICLTTGMATNVLLAIEGVKKIISNFFSFSRPLTIGIIAATSILGENIAKALVDESRVIKVVLHGRSIEHLTSLRDLLLTKRKNWEVSFCLDTTPFIEANIIVVAGWVKGLSILNNSLQKGVVIFDIPSNKTFSNSIYSKRSDIRYLNNVYINTPGIDYGANIGLPPKTAYGCLAETIMLAMDQSYEHDFIGRITYAEIELIDIIAVRNGFRDFVYV